MENSYSAIEMMIPHFEWGVELDSLATVQKLPSGSWVRNMEPCSEGDLRGELVRSPFHQAELKEHARLIRDLASSKIRQANEVSYDVLRDSVMGDPDVQELTGQSDLQRLVESCLRATIASGGYAVSQKRGKFILELSAAYKQREQQRLFAASLAAELTTLSERMAAIVPHQGERGTYRENLLRTVLERSLPARYHVATGFIYGCPRQLDILIYDQVDYAPLFREGGVVVVPKEAVRAVIEVKTTLTKSEMEDALGKLADVSGFDDCDPPFFKGVFAFRGPAREDTVTSHIIDYYQAEPYISCSGASTNGCEEQADASVSNEQEIVAAASEVKRDFCEQSIKEPFHHLTALCVDRGYFAEVNLAWVDEQRSMLAPSVRVRKSKTDLQPQTALFIEALSQYLMLPTLKSREPLFWTSALKDDLAVGKIIPIHSEEWGPYIGRKKDAVTPYLLDLHQRVVDWRFGEGWRGKPAELVP